MLVVIEYVQDADRFESMLYYRGQNLCEPNDTPWKLTMEQPDVWYAKVRELFPRDPWNLWDQMFYLKLTRDNDSLIFAQFKSWILNSHILLNQPLGLLADFVQIACFGHWSGD